MDTVDIRSLALDREKAAEIVRACTPRDSFRCRLVEGFAALGGYAVDLRAARYRADDDCVIHRALRQDYKRVVGTFERMNAMPELAAPSEICRTVAATFASLLAAIKDDREFGTPDRSAAREKAVKSSYAGVSGRNRDQIRDIAARIRDGILHLQRELKEARPGIFSTACAEN
jgi:hypothetical protein